MKIVERYRDRSKPTREFRRKESEVERLSRQVRRLTERCNQMFDQGFQAAIVMLRAGATLERLVEASGVVSGDWQDTEPVEIFNFEGDTMVDEVTQVDDFPRMDTIPHIA